MTVFYPENSDEHNARRHHGPSLDACDVIREGKAPMLVGASILAYLLWDALI